MDEREPLGSLGKSLRLNQPMKRRRSAIDAPPALPASEEKPPVVEIPFNEGVRFSGHFHLSDNAIETELAPKMSPFEYVIYRRLWFDSYGGMGGSSRKTYCRAGYDYLERMTACKSRKAVITGVKGLLEKGFILRLENDKNHPGGSLYRVLRPHEILHQLLDEGIDLVNRQQKSFVGTDQPPQPQEALPSKGQPQQGIPQNVRVLHEGHGSQGRASSHSPPKSTLPTAATTPSQARADSPKPPESGSSHAPLKKESREEKEKEVPVLEGETPEQLLQSICAWEGRDTPRKFSQRERDVARTIVRQGEALLNTYAHFLAFARERLIATPPREELMLLALPPALIHQQRLKAGKTPVPYPAEAVDGPEVDPLIDTLIADHSEEELTIYRTVIRETFHTKDPKTRQWSADTLNRSIQSVLRLEFRRLIRGS